MAIYALAIKHKAKGSGASAKAHAQYIAREGRYAERLELKASAHAEYLTREGKYQGRAHELDATWSGNMPEWAKKPGEFWEAADTYERANGRVYTEVVIALPRELSQESRERVVRDFVEREIGERFTYTVAIHNPLALDGGEQPHAHVMFSIRERDGIERPRELYFKRANPECPEKGGVKKSREWSKDERSNNRVQEIRASWEELANKALKREGHEVRIDRRTLKAQGIEREPEPKMGPAVTQRLKRGLETETGVKVIELRAYRAKQREIDELERELKSEQAKVLDFGKGRAAREEKENSWTFDGPRREVPEEERRQYQRTVDLVLTRHERQDGDTEYRWKNSGHVAFVDRGDVITFGSINPTAVKAGLQVAQEKGWEAVRVTGSEEFRRESWLQGELLGLKVQGFEPLVKDLELLKERQQEQTQKLKDYQDKEKERAIERQVPERERVRECKVIETEAEKLAAEFMNEIIPALEQERKKTMEELRSLGYEGSPNDLLYMYGTLKRWPGLPSDEALREKTFEKLSSSYKKQKEELGLTLAREAERERTVEKLTQESKSFLKKLSLTHNFEKKRATKELNDAREERSRAQEWLEAEKQRLSTGKNKDIFDETLKGLTEERTRTKARRVSVEARHTELSTGIAEAYRFREKLQALGKTRVRFVHERGRGVRPEDEREFERQYSKAQEQARKLDRGMDRDRGFGFSH